MNKRAMEWPTFLISTIFSMLLFFIGIIMILDVATAQNIGFDFKTEQLNYGLLASRMLNSADCLAWEEKTPDGYIVRAGILDESKFNPDWINNCISGKKYYAGFFPLGESTPMAAIGNGLRLGDQLNALYYGGTSTPVEKKYHDWFAAKIYFEGQLYDGTVLVAVK